MGNLALFPPAFKGVPRGGGASGPSTFSGTLPSTVAELNGWTQASIWDFAHNFKDVTGSPNTCNAVTGSTALQLTRLGTTQATTLAAPQSNYAGQTGIQLTTSQATLYKSSSLWPHSATVPTVYLLTFKFDGTPADGQVFLSGNVGDGLSGFRLVAHSTVGIRLGIGNGSSGYTNTSYICGTALYDGNWHTLAYCVDDAGGKVKIICEGYSTESTGLTISAPATTFFCVGGEAAADPTWSGGCSISYLLCARGQHPLAYTNFETALDNYEDARLNNTAPASIAGLPTTLAELNTATGLTFTHGWNMVSATSNPPLTGASGVTLAPNTGTLTYGGTGTAPTLVAAPQVRTSFTSQAAIMLDSSKDNMQGSDLWPAHDFTGLIVIKCNLSTNDGIAAKRRSTAGERGFVLRTDGSNLNLWCYSSHPTVASHSAQVPLSWSTTYAPITFRVPGSAGQESRICPGSRTKSNSGVAYGTPGTESGSNPTIGAESQDAANTSYVAFSAYLSGQVADATMDAAHDAFRWKYGI